MSEEIKQEENTEETIEEDQDQEEEETDSPEDESEEQTEESELDSEEEERKDKRAGWLIGAGIFGLFALASYLSGFGKAAAICFGLGIICSGIAIKYNRKKQ
jgi:hypothetical protein